MMAQQRDEKYGDALEPVAIIGMACRFPGDASNVASFWDMMCQGRSAQSRIPESRFNIDAFYHPYNDRRGAINTKNGYFLKEDPGNFDAPFFNLTLKEASGMDPMHRLTLETAYESLENAGIPMSTLIKSNTSVFHGCFTGDYDLLANDDIYNAAPYQATGSGLTMLSNRLSWFFDLRGPSMTIDTACSSSLYAIHLACQSLRAGESEMSIVSGSNLILYPDMMISLTGAHFLGPDGVSRSFDARASGYARGEAIGAVILKPLSKALRDGDTIRAVIRGTGTNQDGKTPGITQPNSAAQADLINATYKRAGLELAETGYFEAHGTGTSVGDPIEMSAIGATMGAARHAGQVPLYVGSVKTNIGHTEGCSGLAGVIKAVLCLEHGKLPPNSGFESLNPKLKLQDWNMALPLKLMEWPTLGLRRACINSFGYGGSNAVAVIDDAHHYLTSRGLHGNHQTSVTETDYLAHDSGFNSPASTPGSENSDRPQHKLLTFSAADEAGVKRLSETYSKYLSQHMNESPSLLSTKLPDWRRYFDDLVYTLACRRSVFDYRSYTVAPSLGKAVAALETGLPKQKRTNRKCNAIWVFTGQGAQYAEMGKELINNDVFHESLLQSQYYLEEAGCVWDVIEELTKGTDSRVSEPEFSQPICTVLQIALVDLLTYWGLKPTAVLGHSSGEVAAAFASGAINHKDAITIAFKRGIFSKAVLDRQANGPGGMAAVGLSAAEVQPYIDQLRPGALVVACINSPSSVTVSGDLDMIAALESNLKENGVFIRKLKVSTAYHSHHMVGISEEYRASMGVIDTIESENAVPMFSSVTGKLASAKDFNADYWVANLVSPVKFVDACKSLLAYSPGRTRRNIPVSWSTMIEIGPSEVLKGPLNQILASVDPKLVTSILYTSVLKRGEDAEVAAAVAAGKLWSQGWPVSVARVNGLDEENTLKVLPDLPSYPWNHSKRYWHEPPRTKNKRTRKHPRTDLLGLPVDDQNQLEPRWRNFLSIGENPWLEHHRITDAVLFPGAGMLIMAIEAANQIADESREVKGFELRDMTFEAGLLIPSADQAIETALNFHVHSSEGGKIWWRYVVFSLQQDGSWTKHHSGLISTVYKDESRSAEQTSEADEEWKAQTEHYRFLQECGTIEVKHEKFYQELEAVGMQYGPLFTNVIEAHAAPGTSSGHGKIKIPDTKSSMPHQFEYPHMIHPATLDAIFHMLFIGFTEGRPLTDAGVPYSMESMYISADLPKTPGDFFRAYSVTTQRGERESAGSLVISDSDWSEPKIIINHFAARQVTSGSGASMAEDHKICSQIHWHEDVNHIKADSAVSLLQQAGSDVQSQLGAWLQKLCFKTSQPRVLMMTCDYGKYKNLIQNFGPQIGQRLRFGELTITSSTDEQADSIRAELLTSQVIAKVETMGQADLQGPFDLILTEGPKHEFKHLATLLAIRGRLVVVYDRGLTDPKPRLAKATLSVDFEAKAQDQAWLVASKATNTSDHKNQFLLISSSTESDEATCLRNAVTDKLTDQGHTVSHCVGLPGTVSKDQKIISLMEVERPWVVHWTAADLEAFQKLVYSATYLLWLTKGGQMLEAGNPDFAASTGLLRTMRTEVPQITLAHLDLSPSSKLSTAVDMVLDVYNSTNETEVPDLEYAEKDGRLWIPRVLEDSSFDRELEYGTGGQKSIQGYLNDDKQAFKLVMSTPGLLESALWIPDDELQQPLGPDEVQIATAAYGLNAIDFLAASGDTKFTKIGYEASGVVTAVGSGASRFSVGQRVATIGLDSCKTIIKQHQDLVQEVPNAFEQKMAAGCGHIFTTAYHAIVQLAQLQEGESILITSAAGGIGQTVIQIAQHIGANIFATVGSDNKKKTLMQLYGIPEDHIFSSKDADFAKGIKRMTSGQGADVVLSFNTGEKLRHTCSSLAVSGRFVDLSLNTDSSNLGSKQFNQNASFFSVNMHELLKTKPEKVTRAFRNAFGLVRRGILKSPHPLTIFDACDVEKAFRTIQSGEHIGKLVLDLQSPLPVPMMATPPQALKLDPNVTYILSGGLGGLGPSLAQTMVDAGARSLAFLSRSGASTQSAKQILDNLRSQGCEAEAFACDVSNREALQAFLKEADQRDWKIKGLIQCAMVLRDSTFDNMTFEKWTQATQPKIQGSWNLHELLPADLDFFIMLSSVVGIIGNSAQANYIAGNTYMDALAHLRRAQGKAAVSLDVGVVSDSGHFTDDAAFENFLDRFPHLAPLQMTTPELQRVLSTLLKGHTMDKQSIPAQLIAGINDCLTQETNITSTWSQDPKFAHRYRTATATAATASATINASTCIKNAKTLKEAAAAVQSSLQFTIATAMSTEPAEIDCDLPLSAFGVDSLKAVEVRNWVFRELKAEISVFEILAAVPMSTLAVQIAKRSRLLDPKVMESASGEDDGEE